MPTAGNGILESPFDMFCCLGVGIVAKVELRFVSKFRYETSFLEGMGDAAESSHEVIVINGVFEIEFALLARNRNSLLIDWETMWTSAGKGALSTNR